MRVLLDADIIAFASSASAQTRAYSCRGQEFSGKTGKKDLKQAFPDVADEEIEIVVRAEPLSHARQNCRQLVQSILDACAPVSSYGGYLTGSGNFRYAIAKTQPYKGARADQILPVWLPDVRQHLVDEYNCEVVEGIEADDKLVIEYLKDPKNTIVATQDKDMNQVPGIRIYNWKKRELVVVSPLDAHRNFYAQLLTGDTTDSIPGIPGVGDKTAEKILGNLKDEKLMLIKVYSEYVKFYGKKAWEVLCEQARLLWLLRDEQDIASPHTAWKPAIVPEGAL